MDVDYSGLVDEIGTELVEFFDELSRFPDLGSRPIDFSPLS